MTIIKLNARSREAVDASLRHYLKMIQDEEEDMGITDLDNEEETENKKGNKRALVVDGKTLIYILDKRANLQKQFLALTAKCTSVLCCR